MSEFTLVIGNKNYSSWSLRAWIWMRHMQLDFDEVVVPLYDPDMPIQLGRLFSGGKVPVLQHGELEIWDSLAILEYISALYPEHALPADIQAHAVMRAVCAEMHSSFGVLRKELPMNCRRRRSALKISRACREDIDRIEALWQHAAAYSDRRDHWLFGSFSMADAMFAPVVFRFHRYAVELGDSSSAYVERMLAHPAMLEWLQASRTETWVIEAEER